MLGYYVDTVWTYRECVTKHVHRPFRYNVSSQGNESRQLPPVTPSSWGCILKQSHTNLRVWTMDNNIMYHAPRSDSVMTPFDVSWIAQHPRQTLGSSSSYSPSSQQPSSFYDEQQQPDPQLP